MNVGSLFSGIGGLDLGLERAGMNVIWQSEIDPYAYRVLAKHWPTVPNLGDITTIDWTTVERPDLICGGYPCQPFSLAGVRRGQDDPRHLWPHFRDAIRHLRPRFALLENVPGHLSLGFGRVLGDLAELGYNTEWDCIPAAAVGAPHLRYRVIVVAHTDEYSEPGCPLNEVPGSGELVPDALRDVVRQQPVSVGRGSGQTVARDNGPNGDVADSDSSRRGEVEQYVQPRQPDAQRRGQLADTDGTPWRQARATEPPPGGRTELRAPPQLGGLSGGVGGSAGTWWATEPGVGRVADGVPSRLHGGGVDAQSGSDQEARPAGSSDDDRLFGLRWDGSTPPPSPGLLKADGGGDRLLSLPRGDRRPGRYEGDSQAEDLRDMRGDVHGVQPFTREELLARMQQRGRQTERDEAVGHWAIEPDIPRVATDVAHRVGRLRTLGNAVVPQVAEWVGRRIMAVANPS